MLGFPSWVGMGDPRFHQYWGRRNLAGAGATPQLLVSRLRHKYRVAANSRLTVLRPSVRYFGVHVRHGDKIWEAPLEPFTNFMREVEKLSSHHQMHDIYLATDNSTIIAHDLVLYPRFNFSAQLTHRGGEGTGHWKDGHAPLELLLTTMVDLVKLSKASVFVGSRASGFTQLVHAMRLGRHLTHSHGLNDQGDLVALGSSDFLFDD
jgi:hypothetical protein